MIEYRFSISMSYQEFIDIYYGGGAQHLVVRSDTNVRIAIPAGRMVPFVDSTGVSGRFIIQLDDNNKFVSLKRI
ncbi:uncharacterized protein DUF2835 [Idiomarina fontislapidosi]|uniref:DUF2835 domain-containing protein n=1 Tax=Idiomarina fontislapidosi TaxID=263723 RepID=A0A432Y9P0_9GAMM|nr:DUF2835 family protein [Idiomarina fontislapidosi]PYE34332.1 uncharacterized protein DUF2835 [Idiomarina fontislapidosi]RUO57705.1 DUF2835 domain-containing protein [Idiomarina fontislapidosi]